MLGRTRLLAPTIARTSACAPHESPHAQPAAADGLPVPPPHLIVRVAGTPDAAWFLESGRLAAESIEEALEQAGTGHRGHDLDPRLRLRLRTRHPQLGELDVGAAGSDLSGAAIDWCRENLPFARFETNGLSPPLAFADASFDLAYALSVLTHLPEAIQHEWMDELHRVVRPGGFVLITTHGERYLERLDEDERRRFRAGELVVRWGEVPGHESLHDVPSAGVGARASAAARIRGGVVRAGGRRGNPYQDLFLLRRAAVTRHALLGAFVIVFCVAGLVVGIVRLVPGPGRGRPRARRSSPRSSAPACSHRRAGRPPRLARLDEVADRPDPHLRVLSRPAVGARPARPARARVRLRRRVPRHGHRARRSADALEASRCPSRSSSDSSRRQRGFTFTRSSRKTWRPSSCSISGRARVPISLHHRSAASDQDLLLRLGLDEQVGARSTCRRSPRPRR